MILRLNEYLNFIFLQTFIQQFYHCCYKNLLIFDIMMLPTLSVAFLHEKLTYVWSENMITSYYVKQRNCIRPLLSLETKKASSALALHNFLESSRSKKAYGQERDDTFKCRLQGFFAQRGILAIIDTMSAKAIVMS